MAPPAHGAQHRSPSRAHRAFDGLQSWLGLTDDELAGIVGISRSAVESPQKASDGPEGWAEDRRLYQLHAVVGALHQVLGDGLATWLSEGEPSPLGLLESGDAEPFERLADEVIFPRTGEPRPRLDTAWPPRTD